MDWMLGSCMCTLCTVSVHHIVDPCVLLAVTDMGQQVLITDHIVPYDRGSWPKISGETLNGLQDI